jgi:hypothetical protein
MKATSSFGGKSYNNINNLSIASRKSAGSLAGRLGATGTSFNMGASFGGTLQATVPMNFHGQDRTSKAALGSNPNAGSVEDEYI